MAQSFATLKVLITTRFLNGIQLTTRLRLAKALKDNMQRLQKLNYTKSLNMQVQKSFRMLQQQETI